MFRFHMIMICVLQQIATRMVLQYGWGPDDSPAVYYATNAVTFFLIIEIGSIPRLMSDTTEPTC